MTLRMTDTQSRLDAIDGRIDRLTKVLEQLVSEKRDDDNRWFSSSTKHVVLWLGVFLNILLKLIGLNN